MRSVIVLLAFALCVGCSDPHEKYENQRAIHHFRFDVHCGDASHIVYLNGRPLRGFGVYLSTKGNYYIHVVANGYDSHGFWFEPRSERIICVQLQKTKTKGK
jgi:hypothetical protein